MSGSLYYTEKYISNFGTVNRSRTGPLACTRILRPCYKIGQVGD